MWGVCFIPRNTKTAEQTLLHIGGGGKFSSDLAADIKRKVKGTNVSVQGVGVSEGQTKSFSLMVHITVSALLSRSFSFFAKEVCRG